jgi:hypothetical protein
LGAYKAFSQGGTRQPRVLYEQLPESEREAYAADFEIVMNKLFGKDPA